MSIQAVRSTFSAFSISYFMERYRFLGTDHNCDLKFKMNNLSKPHFIRLKYFKKPFYD